MDRASLGFGRNVFENCQYDTFLFVGIVCDWILNVYSFQIQKIHIERVQYDARPYVGDQPTAGQSERNCEDPVRPAGEPDFLR